MKMKIKTDKTNQKTMSHRLSILGLLWLLVPISLVAQEDPMTFTLEEALNYATENAYQTKSADYDIDAARKKVWEYLALGLPQLNMEGGLSDNLSIQENFIQLTNEKGEVETIKAQFGTKYSWNVGGKASQLIFDGSYFLGVKASRIFVELSQKNKEKTLVDVREAVAQAYYLALIAYQNLENFKQNLKVNEQTLTETAAYYKNGFREEIDVDQIRLMVNTSKNLVLEAERQLIISESVLKFAMGIDINSPIALADNLDILLLPVQTKQNAKDSFRVESHIDYAIMQTQEAIQDVKIRNEQAQYLPKLSAFYSYTHFQMGEEFDALNKTNSQILGLSLSMPIFTSGMRHSKVKQEKINMLKLQNDKIMLEQNLQREVLVANTNLTNARETYQNDKLGVDIAYNIYDKTRIKFSNGLASSTELSQNENQYIQSQVKYIESTMNMLNAHIQYKKAISQL
ncbi:TolC family protein [Marinilabiliaceae bacterium JC017]|nr:TolC family protein [Marinilabiliaceae bacterium JC017]